MKIISKGNIPHVHDSPGAIRRWRLGLKQGAIIQCDCGDYLKLEYYPISGMFGWERLDWHAREKLGLNEKREGYTD